jgi:hypothetical protein
MHPHANTTTRMYGKHSGTVIDNNDPLLSGRLQVEVPSVLDTVQVWARPCVPYGHFFIPSVGTKVWIEFEAGDLSYPIWVGTWFANGEVPQDAQVGPPDNRVVQTKSGHAIELDDTDGAEKLIVRHKIDSFVSIDEKGSVLLANQNGSHVYLNADGKEASVVSEQGNVVAMSDDGIVVTAKDGTTIQLGDGKVKITASGNVQLTSGGQIILTGAGIALGGATAQMTPMLLEQFTAIWASHTYPSAMGPTGPPIPPVIPPTAGSQSVKVAP